MENLLLLIVCIGLGISVLLNLAPFISDKFHRSSKRFVRNLEEENENLRAENHRKEIVIRRTKYQNEELRLEVVKVKGELDKVIGTQKKVSILLYLKNGEKNSGFLWRKQKMEYWEQLQVDGFPVGPPWLFKTELVKEVRDENINKILDQYAKPFLDANLEVWKQIGAEVIKIAITSA